MNHQITLEELGIIPPAPEPPKKAVSTATIPCFDCICHHCANCTECWDICTGEMDEPCYVCEECRYYDGKGKDMWRAECERYKITNKYAEKKRLKFKTVKERKT